MLYDSWHIRSWPRWPNKPNHVSSKIWCFCQFNVYHICFKVKSNHLRRMNAFISNSLGLVGGDQVIAPVRWSPSPPDTAPMWLKKMFSSWGTHGEFMGNHAKSRKKTRENLNFLEEITKKTAGVLVQSFNLLEKNEHQWGLSSWNGEWHDTVF